MKCFLHIGVEKTATTTLQQFFNINRNKLLQKNLLYTKSAGAVNNRSLSVVAYNLDKFDDSMMSMGLDSKEKLLEFKKHTIDELNAEITQAHKDNPEIQLLFSSEHIQSRLKTKEEIERLKEILYSLGASDISIIVYLRRQAEIINSLYSNGMRAGGTFKYPRSTKKSHIENICNHKNTIERFSSVFGESAIIPRLFNSKELKNGSIIDDFLSVIGVPNDPSFCLPENANEGLSVLAVNILRNLNHRIPLFIDNKVNPHRVNLVSYIEKHMLGEKYVMPLYLYQEYDLEFDVSNEWVRKKYFPNKERLFANTIPKETPLTISEEELERVSSCIASIWLDKQQEIINLTN